MNKTVLKNQRIFVEVEGFIKSNFYCSVVIDRNDPDKGVLSNDGRPVRKIEDGWVYTAR